MVHETQQVLLSIECGTALASGLAVGTSAWRHNPSFLIKLLFYLLFGSDRPPVGAKVPLASGCHFEKMSIPISKHLRPRVQFHDENARILLSAEAKYGLLNVYLLVILALCLVTALPIVAAICLGKPHYTGTGCLSDGSFRRLLRQVSP